MALPDTHDRVCEIQLPASEVDETRSDMGILLEAGSLPDESLTTGDSNAAQSDGGDLRFATDLAGTDPIPLEVVRWSQNATIADARATLRVKADVDSSTTQSIYMFYKTSGTDTQPAVTASEGRNAVWEDACLGCLHLASDPTSTLPDSTGNGNDGTSFGSMTSGDLVDGHFGQGLDFDGNNDYIDLGAFASIEAIPEMTVLAWAYVDHGANSSFNAIWSHQISSNKVSQLLLGGSLGGSNDIYTRIHQTGTGTQDAYTNTNWLTAFNWFHTAVVFDGGETGNAKNKFYQSGAQETLTYRGTHTGTVTPTVASNINVARWVSNEFNGRIQALRFYDRAMSANEISTIYNNENDAATFAVAQTPQDTAEAGAVAVARLVRPLTRAITRNTV